MSQLAYYFSLETEETELCQYLRTVNYL